MIFRQIFGICICVQSHIQSPFSYISGYHADGPCADILMIHRFYHIQRRPPSHDPTIPGMSVHDNFTFGGWIVGWRASLYMIIWCWTLARWIIDSIHKYLDIGIECEKNDIGYGPNFS